MTAIRDPDRLIHRFLLEGEEELHDQVYDAVRAAIERKRQRVIFGPWTTPIVNKIVGFGLAAAAVVAVVLIGSRLFGSPTTNVGGPGYEPTPTPEASVAEPSAEPSSTPSALPVGSHVLWDPAEGEPGVRITVTIPAPGWHGEPGGGIIENSDPEQNFGPDDAGMIGPFVGDIYVPADPCRWSTTMPDTPATTVDAVVAALQAQGSRDASEPVDITVDGHAGKSITLHVPDDAVFAQCDWDGEARFCTLAEGDPSVCHRFNQFPGQIDEVWILNVDGEVTVFDAGWGDEAPTEDVAQLRSILESMTFEAP